MKHITEHALKNLLRKGTITVQERMIGWGFNSMTVGSNEVVFGNNVRGYADIIVIYSDKRRVKKIITDNIEIL